MGVTCRSYSLCFEGWQVCVCVCVCVCKSVHTGKRDRGRENSTVHPADQSFTRNKITKGSKQQHSSTAAHPYPQKRRTEVGCGLAVARIHFMDKGKKKAATMTCFLPSQVRRNKSRRRTRPAPPSHRKPATKRHL